MTLVVKDGDNQATLTLTEQEREVMGLEGLSPFLPWTAAGLESALPRYEPGRLDRTVA